MKPTWVTPSGNIANLVIDGIPTVPIFKLQYLNANTIKIVSGNLPDGLFLTDIGEISGTLYSKQELTYNFTVRIYNGNEYADQTFNIKTFNHPTWTTPPGLLQTVTTTFTPITLSYNYATNIIPLGDLPPGLSIVGNNLTGTLPTNIISKTYNFTLRILNPAAIEDRNFTIIINRQAGWVTPSTLPTFYLNQQISYPITSIDYNQTYTFVNGSLPKGVSFINGTLTGIVQETNNFTFTVKSVGTITQTQTFTMITQTNANPLVWITLPNWLGNIYTQQPFNFQLSGTGNGTIKYIVSLGSQNIPGLNIAPGQEIQNGLIQGYLTDTTTTNYYFTVILTDNQHTLSRNFYLAANVPVNNTTTNFWG